MTLNLWECLRYPMAPSHQMISGLDISSISIHNNPKKISTPSFYILSVFFLFEENCNQIFFLPPFGPSVNSLQSSFLLSLNQLSHARINKCKRTDDLWIHYSSNNHFYSWTPINIVLKVALNNLKAYWGVKYMQ